MKTRLLILTFAFSLAAAPAASRSPSAEVGTPFITNYSFRDYDAHPQNWAIAQDPRGVMYFGNSDGVLEFDGDAWRLMPVTNGSIVRSLDVDRRGTVFVGAIGDLGYLEPGEDGALAYRSLVGELPAEARDLGDVWRTFATDEGVFFWSYAGLFRWRDGRFRTWRINSHRVPAVVEGKLYYNSQEGGLRVLAGDRFEPVPGTEQLAGIRIDVILPAEGGALLLGTREGRLLTLSPPDPSAAGDPAAGPRRLEPFVTEADEFLAAHRLYRALRLPDGSYLLATMDGGAVIVGRRGEWLHRLDRDRGLPDNSVWAAHVDRQGGLWLGLNRGLSRVEIFSPFTVFGETSGIDGTVEAIGRHGGAIYAATGVGLYRLTGGRFEPVPGVAGPCWSLLSHRPAGAGGERLLAGAHRGVYEVAGGRARLVRATVNAFQLFRSIGDPSLVLVGEAGGLGLLRFEAGDWVDGGALEGVRDNIRSIAEDSSGNLWLGTLYDGVVRLPRDGEGRIAAEGLVRYGSEHGLPSPKGVKIHRVDDRLLFATERGLLVFDPAAERFVPGPSIDDGSSSSELSLLRLAPGRQGDLWLSQELKSVPGVARKRPDSSYVLEDAAFHRLPQSLWYALYPEPDGVVWMGGTEGLFRYDSGVETNFDPGFRTLIQSVSKQGGTRLYAGSSAVDSLAPAVAASPLPYDENSLIFQFSATSFSSSENTRFRYRLEGFDDDWSQWSLDRKKEYTNLPEGDYRFRVQGRNIYGTIGVEAVYEIGVLPPWYRTTGFRAVVLVAAAALLWAVSLGLVARTRRIQKAVSAREQAVERERLIGQLEEKNIALERFAYTVAHDLKAPLVTIQGFLGLLKRDVAAGNTDLQERDYARIEGAAEKMYRLLDDLLDLSRVGLQLSSTQEVHLADLAGEVLELISGQLRERGVEVVVDPDLPAVVGERPRLLELLQNLLQNAVKYMGDQPSPLIEVGVLANGRPAVGEEAIVYVRDNGMGIEPEYHDKIFGLFERLDAETEGTGIGLALVKRIVEVHGGRIWVESEGAGHGSTFCFTLPRSL